MRTVLIVDWDLSFVFWLGTILDGAGYQAIPAKDIPNVISLVDQFKLEIDLLIVNPSLSEAVSWIDSLRQSRKSMKVIGVVEDSEAPHPTGVDASKPRPSRFDQRTRSEWLHLIRTLLDCPVPKLAGGFSEAE